MLHPLSNIEIDNYLSKIKGSAPTVARDQLPNKILNKEYRVVNLDESSNSGSHWSAVINDPKLKYSFYFDSYGLSPPPEVVKYMKTSKKNIYYNSSQIQLVNSVACGFYCLYVIEEFSKGRPIYDILYSFNQKPTEFNESFITRWAKSRKLIK